MASRTLLSRERERAKSENEYHSALICCSAFVVVSGLIIWEDFMLGLASVVRVSTEAFGAFWWCRQKRVISVS